jgi:hypothetical protein
VLDQVEREAHLLSGIARTDGEFHVVYLNLSERSGSLTNSGGQDE